MSWRSWLRLLSALLVFVIEVRVRAEPSHAAQSVSTKPAHLTQAPSFAPLEEPAACWKQSGPCAIKNRQRTEKIKLTDLGFVLGPETVLLRTAAGRFELISGQLWAHPPTGSVQINHRFGRTECKRCEAFFSFSGSDRLELVVHSGMLKIWPRGAKESFELPEGFRSWLYWSSALAKADYEIPQLVFFPTQLKLWSEYAPLSREEKKKQAPVWISALKERLPASASLKSEWAEQWIRDEITRKQDRAARRKALEDERRRLRVLFQEKNFLN